MPVNPLRDTRVKQIKRTAIHDPGTVAIQIARSRNVSGYHSSGTNAFTNHIHIMSFYPVTNNAIAILHNDIRR